MRIAGKIAMVAKLVRLPNLLIIVLTMILIRIAILEEILFASDPSAISGWVDFSLLLLATILIAAAGYVINDYFDIRTDEINRPDRRIVQHQLSTKTAVKIHIILNGVAILIGFYLGYRIDTWSFAMIFPVVSIMLWFYSARYKSMLFWGNLIVAFLSALVLVITWMFEFFWMHLQPEVFARAINELPWVTRLVLIYALFAFLTSLVREIIKDVEDEPGDRTVGCRTIPIVYGRRITHVIILLLVLATMGLLAYFQLILSRLNFMAAVWFLLLAVQVPLLFLIFRLFFPGHKDVDYRYLSILIKVIMVGGILSIQLLSFS